MGDKSGGVYRETCGCVSRYFTHFTRIRKEGEQRGGKEIEKEKRDATKQSGKGRPLRCAKSRDKTKLCREGKNLDERYGDPGIKLLSRRYNVMREGVVSQKGEIIRIAEKL